MADPFAVGLTAIAGVFAEPVIYRGAGLDGGAVRAVRVIEPADPLTGLSGKGQRVYFEIPIAALPGDPKKSSDTILHAGALWQVSDTDRRDDVSAWRLYVRRA